MIEMFSHSLQEVDVSNARLVVVACGTGGEESIGQRILELERELIRCESARAAATTTTTRSHAQQQVLLKDAETVGDVVEIVALLSQAPSVPSRISCLETLHRLCHRNARNKSLLVDCGGIAIILSTIQQHHQQNQQRSSSPTLLRVAFSMLVNLPFYKDAHTALVDRLGNEQSMQMSSSSSSSCFKKQTSDHETLDMSIALLLTRHTSIFDILATSVQDNHFDICLHRPGDENGNYERILAAKHIPAVCKSLCLQQQQQPAGSMAKSMCVRQRWLFLRTCLASYLGDTSITADTLGAFVL
jgi:hypothetical protein